MEDKYPRVSQAQFDIWLDNPVTKTYMQCLIWSGEQIKETIGNCGFIDSTNNDLSMNNIHSAVGEHNGLSKAGDPEDILNTHKLLEEEED